MPFFQTELLWTDGRLSYLSFQALPWMNFLQKPFLLKHPAMLLCACAYWFDGSYPSSCVLNSDPLQRTPPVAPGLPPINVPRSKKGPFLFPLIHNTLHITLAAFRHRPFLGYSHLPSGLIVTVQVHDPPLRHTSFLITSLCS